MFYYISQILQDTIRIERFLIKEGLTCFRSLKRLLEASDDWEGGFQGHSKGRKRRGDLTCMDGSSKNLQKGGTPPRREGNQRTWKQECLLFSFN